MDSKVLFGTFFTSIKSFPIWVELNTSSSSHLNYQLVLVWYCFVEHLGWRPDFDDPLNSEVSTATASGTSMPINFILSSASCMICTAASFCVLFHVASSGDNSIYPLSPLEAHKFPHVVILCAFITPLGSIMSHIYPWLLPLIPFAFCVYLQVFIWSQYQLLEIPYWSISWWIYYQQ